MAGTPSELFWTPARLFQNLYDRKVFAGVFLAHRLEILDAGLEFPIVDQRVAALAVSPEYLVGLGPIDSPSVGHAFHPLQP
jgi:hypothetical protein